MGSTLGTIRNLLENQIDSGETDLTTDPTSTILNLYINNSIRRIVRTEKPRELYSPTVTTSDITINTNTVTLSSSIFVPDLVYYERSSGSTIELRQKPIKQMIDIESPNKFFDTDNVGDPDLYDVRGTSLIFNKYFSRTATGAIKIYGIGFPTTLSNDSDTTELPIDYDLLIVYESAVLYYQKDDDLENQQKFQILAAQERANMRIFLDTNDSDSVQLDPYTFTGNNQRSIRNPDVFFTG